MPFAVALGQRVARARGRPAGLRHRAWRRSHRDAEKLHRVRVMRRSGRCEARLCGHRHRIGGDRAGHGGPADHATAPRPSSSSISMAVRPICPASWSLPPATTFSFSRIARRLMARGSMASPSAHSGTPAHSLFARTRSSRPAAKAGWSLFRDEADWRRAWSYRDHGKDRDLRVQSARPRRAFAGCIRASVRIGD